MSRTVATRGMAHRPAAPTVLVRPLLALLVLLLLASCGGGGGESGARPTGSPTRSVTRSPTVTPPSPTRSRTTSAPTSAAPTSAAPTSAAPSSAPPTTSRPSTAPPTTAAAPTTAPPATNAPTSAAPTSAPPSTAPPAGASSSTQDEGTPSWVWWLLAAVLLGAAVAIPLLVRARRRKAWRRQLAEAEGELGWFARELLPELRRAMSREQVAGGWAISSARVAEAEDRLTVLESTAPDDAGQARARALRDASRLARGRMEDLVAPGPHDTWALDLDAVMADLEAALGPPPEPPA